MWRVAAIYAGGVLSHLTLKWLQWQMSDPSRPFSAYWKQYWPMIGSATLLALPAFLAQAELLVTTREAFLTGFAVDSVGKTAVLAWQNRRSGNGSGK